MAPDLTAAAAALRTGEERVRREAALELGRTGAAEAVPLLLLGLGDESWPVRHAAAEALAGFPAPTLLPVLEAALRDQVNAGLRNAAMETYVRLGGPAVPSLLALLGDRDEEVRNFAAVMLGTVADRRAAAPLIAALQDSDLNVRHAAAASLGRIGAREAVPALLAQLRSEAWLQYPVIHALAEIGDPSAARELLPLLDDPALRGPVIAALGRLAGREALPRLVQCLSDPDPDTRSVAVQAVVALEERATAQGDSLDPRVQDALRGGDLVEHLLGMLRDEDPHSRRTAATTLGWLKEPRAERPLLELLAEPELRDHAEHALVLIGFKDAMAYGDALHHPADAVRQAAVRCLALLAPPGALELVAPLVRDPAREVRAEAVGAIGRLGDEGAAGLLLELLADESEVIQERAMEALAQMPPERVAPLLVSALGGGNETVRVRAAETLGLLGEPGTAPDLMRLAGDRREAVRRAAIKALGGLEAPGVAPLLRAALRDESSLVREQAALSLGRAADPAAAAELLPLLQEPDPRLRFAAIRALGQLRSPQAVPRLIPLLQERTKELRFAAVEALGAIRAAAAVAPLAGVLADPDRSLRRAAAEALGALADPQSVPPLLLALQDEHWSVRCAAAAALGRIRSGKSTPALLERLSDPDATVRRSVIWALGEIADARAAGRLLELVRDPLLQPTALEALRRMGPAALGEIERGFARSPAETRGLLVDLVHGLADPRALKLLLSCLADESERVRAEAALALGEGAHREALRPLLDLKGRDPSPAVRRAAAQALRKLTPRVPPV